MTCMASKICDGKSDQTGTVVAPPLTTPPPSHTAESSAAGRELLPTGGQQLGHTSLLSPGAGTRRPRLLSTPMEGGGGGTTLRHAHFLA